MRIYTNKSVLEASLDRIRYLFDEFETVVVGFSGGKDSTVVLELALQVAREKNKLPLKVMWIDQEAEWQGTVDFARDVMYREEVDPYWFQIPMVITNNSSSFDRYNHCWDAKEKDKWVHPQDPLSKKENVYGTDRFHELFEKIFAKEFKGQKACYLAGVRAQEAPKRNAALSTGKTYKHITWGKQLNKRLNHYTFYPLYDWSYTDIWKYIHDNKCPYNKVYDEMYRHGVKIQDMRISNVHHETAIQVLMLIQEIEPETWNKLSKRIPSVNTIKHLKKNAFSRPKELPHMFADWEEYALYLSDKMIQQDEHKLILYKYLDKRAELFSHPIIKDDFYKKVVDTILSSDWDLTKLKNFEMSPNVYGYTKYMRGVADRDMFRETKYLTPEMIQNTIERIKNGTSTKQNKR